jgi:hypothetical protein
MEQQLDSQIDMAGELSARTIIIKNVTVETDITRIIILATTMRSQEHI